MKKIKLAAAADAGSGGGSVAVAEKPTVEIVDGHTIGADLTAAELGIVETADGYAAGVLAAAVQEKAIRAFWSSVLVSDKKSPTGKGGNKSYARLMALTGRGMGILTHGKIEPAADRPVGEDTRSAADKAAGACDFFNYGFDLDRKAPVRTALLGTLEGPEKAVKKTVLGLLAAEMSPAEIRAFVKSTGKFKDVAGIDKLIDSALA